MLPGDEAFDHERHHAARMREDPRDLGITRGGSAEDQAGDGSGGVGAIFDYSVGHVLHDIPAAVSLDGMNIDHCLAAVEFLVKRFQRFIAKPDVPIIGEQSDSVRLQGVEHVLHFAQCAIGIGGRKSSKAAEPSFVIGTKLRGVFVRLADHLAHLVSFTKVKPGSGDRKDGGLGAAAIHIFEVFC